MIDKIKERLNEAQKCIDTPGLWMRLPDRLNSTDYAFLFMKDTQLLLRAHERMIEALEEIKTRSKSDHVKNACPFCILNQFTDEALSDINEIMGEK